MPQFMGNEVMQLWQLTVAMLVFSELPSNQWHTTHVKQLDNDFPFIPKYLITCWICSQHCQNPLTQISHHLHMPGTQF